MTMYINILAGIFLMSVFFLKMYLGGVFLVLGMKHNGTN